MTENPQVLLDELSGLRKRARADRHGYWFPLLLFGALTFAAMPLYARLEAWAGPYSDSGFFVFDTYVDPFRMYLPDPMMLKYPNTIGTYWTAALVVGFAATVWWYQWQAERVGVETPTRAYAWAMALALSVPMVGTPVAWVATATSDQKWVRYLVAFVLLAAVSTAALAALRPVVRSSFPLVVAVPTATTCALIAVTMGDLGHVQLLVLAVGLLVLAWVERSRLFWAIAVVFAVTAVLTNLHDLTNLSFTGDNLLLPGAVLVLGGIIGLVEQRKGRP